MSATQTIANARWNNVNAMEKRILNARSKIDNLNASNATMITDEYLRLKLMELFLTHEHRERLKAERDERAEAARLVREEQKLARDMERGGGGGKGGFERLLGTRQGRGAEYRWARSSMPSTIRSPCWSATSRMRMQRSPERRRWPERTRSGYVYIISNVGSFGEGRRQDRIDEAT